MAKFLSTLLLVVVWLHSAAQRLVVSTDTIHLDVSTFARPGNRLDLQDAIKYKGDFYCFFEKYLSYELEYSKRYFMVYNGHDKKWTEYEMPDELKWKASFTFFERADSLLVYMEEDSIGFCWQPASKKWMRLGPVQETRYEDDHFTVASLNRGEWGNWVWFMDKHEARQYFLSAHGWPILFHGAYYLCSYNSVLRIADPRQLPLADSANRYETIERTRGVPRLTRLVSGVETVFYDSSNVWYNPASERKVSIISSMIIDDQLCQLYMDSTGTHLGVARDGRIISVQNFGRLDLRRRFKISPNIFRIDEFKKDTLHLDYIVHNLDSLPYHSSDGLRQLMELIVQEGRNVSDGKLVSLQAALGAAEVREDLADTWLTTAHPGKPNIDTVKSRYFFLIEDDAITQKTRWHYSPQNDRLRMLSLEWRETIPYNDYGYNIFPPMRLDWSEELNERFAAKQEQIIQTINAATGVVPKKEKSGRSLTMLWILKNGVRIRLTGSTDLDFRFGIRLWVGLL